MSYTEIRRFERPDGLEAITIEADGRFGRYVLWLWMKGDPGNPYDVDHWSPVLFSGLYACADEAESAASNELTWLGELIRLAR